ncbi:hypothetical protein ACHWQZ_G007117 [Mnemiopsis leidyi]
MILLLKIPALLFLTYIGFNLYLFLRRRQYRHIPSPSIPLSLYWFMGHASDLKVRVKRNPLKNFVQIVSEYLMELEADTVFLAIFTDNTILTLDLNIIPKLLTDRTTFLKRDLMRKNMGWCGKARGFGNHGLLIDPGSEVWATKRRIMDPAFTRSFLRTTMAGMNKVAGRLMEVLDRKAESGEVFDISVILDTTALEAISLCGFDWTEDMIKEHGDATLNMARVLVEIFALRFKDPISFKIPWSRLSEKQKLYDAVEPMRQIIGKFLKEKKGEAVLKENIVSSIIRANDCSDDLDIEDLIDDYNVFLIAGMETTAISMACAVWYLSMNPHVYEKAQVEVDNVFGDRDQIDFDDVSKLKYIEMIIKETLRLKGPAFSTMRECKNAAAIKGVCFPKGTKFVVPYHNLHVDPRYWNDPEVFDPERFSPNSIKNIRPYTYMPFSTGPRNCIGKNFAILEMKIILANILRKFVVINANPEEKDIVMMGNITVRPLNGLNVRIHRRYEGFDL